MIVLVTPSLGSDIRAYTNADAPRPAITPWTPGPSSATRNRQMIPAETEPGGGDANQAAEDHIEAVMSVISEAGADDVDG